MATVHQLQTSPSSPSSNFGLEKEVKSRTPIKSVMPRQVLHRTSPLRLRNRISPDTEIIPRLDLSPVIVGKSRAWLVGAGSSREGATAHMRRTASLDAIFHKGAKEADPRFSLLLLNKATQTPDDWVPCCLTEVTPGCGGCAVENSNGSVANSGSSGSSSGSSSRRASGSVPSSPWPTGGAPTPSSGENLEKFIRQRLQRTNKEGSGAAGSRHSPVHGDHSVLAKPFACVQTHICTATEGAVRSASVPQLPRPLLPRFRSSVEELNQEIERLVLRPQSQHGSQEEEEWSFLQDGRRAPIPDYFRFRRSVNTQTPARYSSGASGNGSDQSTPPSMSPTFSPPPVHTATPPDSPPGSFRLSAIASPHINKFLTREPPDGCEKVSLKHSEEKSGTKSNTNWPTTKPAAVFTLLPSLGSAFYAPGRTSGPGRGGSYPGVEKGIQDLAEGSDLSGLDCPHRATSLDAGHVSSLTTAGEHQ